MLFFLSPLERYFDKYLVSNVNNIVNIENIVIDNIQKINYIFSITSKHKANNSELICSVLRNTEYFLYCLVF